MAADDEMTAVTGQRSAGISRSGVESSVESSVESPCVRGMHDAAGRFVSLSCKIRCSILSNAPRLRGEFHGHEVYGNERGVGLFIAKAGNIFSSNLGKGMRWLEYFDVRGRRWRLEMHLMASPA